MSFMLQKKALLKAIAFAGGVARHLRDPLGVSRAIRPDLRFGTDEV